MKMKRFSQFFCSITFFIILSSYCAQSQVPLYPCQDDINIYSLLPGLSPDNIRYSSLVSDDSTNIVGVINPMGGQGNFRTYQETEPWIEVDLGRSMHLTEFTIWYPSHNYQLNDYYLLSSDLPYADNSLNALLASNDIQKFHVLSNAASGTTFQLQDFKGRYIRLQRSGNNVLAITGIDIPGYGENCSNGDDDDCDGDIDCDDSDCAPRIININTIPPTCPICPDGKITVQATQYDIEYSIDGGTTYIPFNPVTPTSTIHLFENLLEGQYNVKVRNSICLNSPSNQDVVLAAPAGIPTEGCENGGFENGNFDGWTALSGRLSDTEYTPGISTSRHSILSATSLPDPFIPLSIPFLGTYTARLGHPDIDHNNNLQDDGAVQSLTYSFIVDQDNADFNFNYAMVMEDPGHTPGANPYFLYRIYYFPTPGNRQTILTSGKIIADSEDPFFEVIPEGEIGNTSDITYKGWTCDGINLSNFIGEEIFVEFETAFCLPGPHFGYAYIDGLCTSPEEAIPSPIIDVLSTVFCKNQTVAVDGTQSTKFNQFKWEVCKLDNNGTVIDCRANNEFTIGYSIEIFEAGNYYTDLGGNFECGYDYQISLTLKNDCAEDQTASQIISYNCSENEVDYKNLFLCNGTNQDFTLEGVNDCNNCEIEWEPSSAFYDNSLAFPTTNASINGFAYSQNYTVYVGNEQGCVYTEEVEIVDVSNIEFELIETNKTFCDFVAGAKVTSLNPIINYDLLVIEIRKIGTNIVDQGVLVSSSNDLREFIFEFPNNTFSREGENIFDITLTHVVSEGFSQIGTCNLTERFTNTPVNFFNTIQYAMPNYFEPNGDGVDDVFGPLFWGQYLMNISWAKFQIFNRWGQLIHDVELSAPIDGPFPIDDLNWDGNFNGQPQPAEVYFYQLEMSNCDDSIDDIVGNVTLAR
jgi:gliding motility-associated-like protein